MDVLALRNGIFSFTQPDLFGLPWYEFFMWGFYLLNIERALGRGTAGRPGRTVWSLALAYATAFTVLPDPNLLLGATVLLLVLALFRFHARDDLAFVLYAVFLGAAVEYTGVGCGAWKYPDPPAGGVPLWFVTLWGGIGFFLHRLVLPLLRPLPGNSNPRTENS